MPSFSHFTKQAARACGIDIRRAHNVPELTFLGLVPPEPEFVLDVGANNGGFLEYASNLFPNAQFHCFEPIAEPRALLEAGLRNGRIRARAQVWPFALGAADAVQDFYRHMDHSPSSSLLQATQFNQTLYPQTSRSETETIAVRSLDSWLAEQQMQIPKNSVLKLDVQGYEAHVLRGAKAALEKFRICIAEVCIAPLYSEQAQFSEIVALLDAAGLSYVGNLDQVHDTRGKPLFLDAVFARTVYGEGSSQTVHGGARA